MHFGQAALLGVLRSVMANAGLRGPVASAKFTVVRFPLFDHDEQDYDMLYASKLELFTAVNAGENVSFEARTASGPCATPQPLPP
ncbi:hypothetical protein ACFWVP_28885 [Streptomyces sp. NPDC058637]|uniref:hypothetical protein n=1 Tax=Streptomyces sp. NPDC058637 TaxID=3346569 RepID=UPI0036560C75